MNNNQNDYNYNNSQSVFTPSVDNGYDLHEKVNEGFGKGLAAVIMASFPIVSIIAIIFGSKAVRIINEARSQAQARGIKLSGKNIAARILGMVGKYAGIAMTVYYIIVVVFYLFAIVYRFSNNISLMSI